MFGEKKTGIIMIMLTKVISRLQAIFISFFELFYTFQIFYKVAPIIFELKEVKAAGSSALGPSKPVSFLTRMSRLHHSTSPLNSGSEGRSQSWKILLLERKLEQQPVKKACN